MTVRDARFAFALLALSAVSGAGCVADGGSATEQVAAQDTVIREQRRSNDALRESLAASEKALAGARAEAERLRGTDGAYRAAAERLEARLRELEGAFQDPTQGVLVEKVEGGGIRFVVQGEVLFGTGEAELTEEGKQALARVAALLKGRRERIRVEGHTDNVPIGKPETRARYPYGNMDLSLDRALHVADQLTREGVEAARVSCAGYGEFSPRADNATAEGRGRNRRVEILVLEK